MRAAAVFTIAAICLIAAAGCSAQKAPAGRWEGIYESQDMLIVARVETQADASVRLSAPDAVGIANVQNDERQAIRTRLARGLASGWDAVAPRKMDFDGKIFRKPGGVAPQLEWNPKNNAATLYVYMGTQVIKIPMHSVSDFSDDPWKN
ncbi:MAG: hypothetical protein HY243_02410 [Proteobacteria bacterium]|nr:hypothetical protein [Pseudomonadota bacterium]